MSLSCRESKYPPFVYALVGLAADSILFIRSLLHIEFMDEQESKSIQLLGMILLSCDVRVTAKIVHYQLMDYHLIDT